jgi:hypothetical protein
VQRLAAVTAATLLWSAVIGDATAQSARIPIGPNQLFAALVNHRTGGLSPVVITVVCPGPVQAGQTGHPTSGQSVGVIPAPASVGNYGYTGSSASRIGAFFGAPPPASGTAASSYVQFRYYRVAKPIPTSLELPCSGSGQVIFVPLPVVGPDARSVSVPVVFENIAV